MKKYLMIFLIFLSACSTDRGFGSLSEKEQINYARYYIFEQKNVDVAEKYLLETFNKYNSREAAILLARLHLGKYQNDKFFWSENGFQNRMKISKWIKPYAQTDKDASFLMGLIYYPHNKKTSYTFFRLSSDLGNAAASLYSGSLSNDFDNKSAALKYYTKALKLNCATAASHLRAISDVSFTKDEVSALELTQKEVQANGILGFETMAAFVNDLSIDEANYWRHMASIRRQWVQSFLEIPIYNMNAACVF